MQIHIRIRYGQLKNIRRFTIPIRNKKNNKSAVLTSARDFIRLQSNESTRIQNGDPGWNHQELAK